MNQQQTSTAINIDDLESQYDVTIIGGGMVGLSLALLLAQSDLNILVVEKFSLSGFSKLAGQKPLDARSSALSYSSIEVFEKLQYWDALAEYVSPIYNVHASQKGGWASTLMSAEEQNLPMLGGVIENKNLLKVLLEKVSICSNISVLDQSQIINTQFLANGVELELQQDKKQQKIAATLLILADGAQSQNAQRLGVSYEIKNYHQQAIIANVVCEKPHQGMAFERFTERGPMAFLPLNDFQQDGQTKHRVSLVWVLETSEAKQWFEQSDEQCLDRLQILLSDRLGRFYEMGERAIFPLKLCWAKEQMRRSMVVMGNAAHSLHPVAGQGFNLAIRDCVSLAEHLEIAKNNQQPIGDLSVLQQYLDARQNDQLRTRLLSDSLPKIFSHSSSVLKQGRSAGLLALDLITPLHAQFVRAAAGLS